MNNKGLVTVQSKQSFGETVSKLQEIIKKAGFMIPVVIDHAAAVEKIGKHIRPTTLIVLGNPHIGVNFMLANQESAIDLPQKILVWEAEDGKVNITYNDPDYFRERHNITGLEEVFEKVKAGLDRFAKEGAADPS